MILEIAKATLPSGGGGLLEIGGQAQALGFDIYQVAQEFNLLAVSTLELVGGRS
jgi:hypothetical protein